MRICFLKCLFPLLLLLGSTGFAQNVPRLSGGFEPNYFPLIFEAVKEPIFVNDSRPNPSVRLVMMRSFRSMVIVRLESWEDYGIVMYKELNGLLSPKLSHGRPIVYIVDPLDGTLMSQPVQVIKKHREVLTAKAYQAYVALLAESEFFEMPNENIERGIRDGSIWVLEVKEGSRYHFYGFRPEADPETKKLCTDLIQLSGVAIEGLD
jgi:hypothetical protein